MQTPSKLKEKIALIKQEIGKMSKDKSNPFFKSKYFDINQILDELKPLEEKHRILITQPLTQVHGLPALSFVIENIESDEKVEYETVLPNNTDPQKMGSTITYFRRYALVSYFGLQAEDDDGNLGAKKEEPKVISLFETVENAIENAKDLKTIDTLNKKITDSIKLTPKEKEELINQLTFKSQEII